MHWWDRAAELTRQAKLRQFGFITTNSLRQTFNRRVIERHMQANPSLSLSFAVPDHPWVDAADGAAVRIAMSCGVSTANLGVLQTVQRESDAAGDEVAVDMAMRFGVVNADLTVGAAVASAIPLLANIGISSPGVKLHGSGFILTEESALQIGYPTNRNLNAVIRQYRNGRDLTDTPRKVFVIDTFGISKDELLTRHPAVFQHLVQNVKPERDQNARSTYRDNWWIFGEPRKEWRKMELSLPRYIATVETAKHRTFQFLDKAILPDNKIIAIALKGAGAFAQLSSRVHVLWAMRSGSWLGVGNDSVYVKTRCFETFPFPELASPIRDAEKLDSGLRRNDERGGNDDVELARKLEQLGEQLDAHRKRQQAAHSELTLTGMYNVLEKLKSREALNAKEKIIHTQGLVSVLKSLHDEIDLCVLDAYGWGDLKALMQVVNGNVCPSPPPSPRLSGDGLPKRVGGAREPFEGAAINFEHHPSGANQSPNSSLALPANPDQRTVAMQGEGGGEGLNSAQAIETKAIMPPMTRIEAIRQLDETLLERLVALNAERAQEEKRGLIRYLSPEFQDPNFKAASAPQQVEFNIKTPEAEEDEASTRTAVKLEKVKWPKTLPEQVRALLDLLKTQTLPAEQIAARFKGVKAPKLGELLQTLVDMGRVRETKLGFGV